MQARVGDQLLILSPTLDQEFFSFTYIPMTGKNHVVQFRESLSGGDWEAATWVVTSVEEALTRVVDPRPGSQGFYRVMAE